MSVTPDIGQFPSGESTTTSGIQAGALNEIGSTLDSLIADGFDILDQGFQQGVDLLLSQQSSASQGLLNSFQTGGQEAFDRALAMQGLGDNPMTGEQINEQFMNRPGTQFQMDQGRRAVESSASARGLLGSGRLIKELEKYGQGVASQNFSQSQAELMQLAQLGQQAAGTDVQRQTQAASLIGQQTQAKTGLLESAQLARTSALSKQQTETTKKTGVKIGNMFITAGAAGA